MKKLFLKTILIYKKVSGIFKENNRLPVFICTDCKFYPSCSDYAIGVINKYGVAKGLIKASVRVLRCSPFSRGGIDLP